MLYRRLSVGSEPIDSEPITGDPTGWLTRQPQYPFADDVALDLVRSREDRRGLVVEPRALPATVAGIVAGAAPQRGGGPEDSHRRVVQSLGHLAPVELQEAALGTWLLSLLEARE